LPFESLSCACICIGDCPKWAPLCQHYFGDYNNSKNVFQHFENLVEFLSSLGHLLLCHLPCISSARRAHHDNNYNWPVCWQINHLGMYLINHPGQLRLPSLEGRQIEYLLACPAGVEVRCAYLCQVGGITA